MDWQLFGSTFALIFIAELPDKTALASVFMATRSNPFAVFLGAAGAFVIQSIVAVSFGSLFRLLPERPVHVFAGLLFFLFAVLMWMRKEEEEAENAVKRAEGGQKHFFQAVGAAFLVIFVAEWGDLTQLATAALAAKYHAPLTLFLAATAALWTVTAVGVAVGHHAKKMINPLLLQRVAALAFVVVGGILMASAL